MTTHNDDPGARRNPDDERTAAKPPGALPRHQRSIASVLDAFADIALYASILMGTALPLQVLGLDANPVIVLTATTLALVATIVSVQPPEQARFTVAWALLGSLVAAALWPPSIPVWLALEVVYGVLKGAAIALDPGVYRR